MNDDDDLTKQWDKITNPKEMLAIIVKYEDYLGYDPYFKSLRDSLLKNAERIAKQN